MRKGYISVLASTSEQIIYADLIDTEKNKTYDYEIYEEELHEIEQPKELDIGTFMLDNPEPIKESTKFGIFKLGIRGTLRRKDIYEDR